MKQRRSEDDRLAELTWSDVEEWAGPAIVSRGRSYQRAGRAPIRVIEGYFRYESG